MYGAGFGPEGHDTLLARRPATTTRYTYRIDTETFAIDQAIKVGAVPKYVAVTPDDTQGARHELVHLRPQRDRRRHAPGRSTASRSGAYPRGIVVSPDSRTAYVAVMGGDVIVRVDLATQQVSNLVGLRRRARATSSSRRTAARCSSATTSPTPSCASTPPPVRSPTPSPPGAQPRSMAISADGSAIYVVNYESSTVTKLRADDLGTLDEQPTDHHPIGITYEPTTATVWVACYGGSHHRLRRLVARLAPPVRWPSPGGVAQLARAPALQAGGRGFESHRLHRTREPRAP